MSLNQSKDKELRVYDGTSPTPQYVIGRFLGDTDSFPSMAPRPEEVYFSDRGVANQYHSFVSQDDSAIYAPIPITINFLLNEAFFGFMDSLGNPDGRTPWSVFGGTFVPVTSIGSRINGRGVLTACPRPADYQRVNFLVNIYVQCGPPPVGGNNLVQELLGFAPTSKVYTLQPPVINVTMEGNIFGGLQRLAAFPTGTELVP